VLRISEKEQSPILEILENGFTRFCGDCYMIFLPPGQKMFNEHVITWVYELPRASELHVLLAAQREFRMILTIDPQKDLFKTAKGKKVKLSLCLTN
jgi:hypothetical protein